VQILAIDGGGVRGVVPSATLAYWETELGFETPDRFSLFAGTSTGAIVAAALATGVSAKRVLGLFQERAPAIFSREGLGLSERVLSFKGWALPAYSNDALRDALYEVIGDATLGDCPRPLCIPCLDVVTGATRIFRSAHHPQAGSDRQIRIVDAVLASAAAPTFFPSAQVAGSSYVDGALWANNPSLIALLDWRDIAGPAGWEEARLVSLGCGRPFWGKNVGFGAQRGLLGWGLPLMALMMAAQSDGVHGYVRRLLPKGHYLRVDPQLPRNLAGLDSPSNVPDLLVRAREAAREHLEAAREIGATPPTKGTA
jgi:hypothetical protein